MHAVTGAGFEGPSPRAEIHEEEPIEDGSRHKVGAKSDPQLVFQVVLVSVNPDSWDNKMLTVASG